ncbi:hypothetical protein MUK42_00328 [Musa troglodytarum]|uniref:Uncharacterized protein n=1 Tax=Musa troglodytarum TaxID=320322 RepID=A0A9E7K5K3_9LILI|nr:hypothetical protein MUK42_00328 [Musa troglodytarum]
MEASASSHLDFYDFIPLRCDNRSPGSLLLHQKGVDLWICIFRSSGVLSRSEFLNLGLGRGDLLLRSRFPKSGFSVFKYFLANKARKESNSIVCNLLGFIFRKSISLVAISFLIPRNIQVHYTTYLNQYLIQDSLAHLFIQITY